MVLVRSEVLGQFVNTITAVYNYIRQNLENLRQQVQTQISLKPKTFSGFFIALMKSTFTTKYPSEYCKTSSYLSVWPSFMQRFGSQHATSSNADISKTENFFWIFYCFNEIYVKFRVF